MSTVVENQLGQICLNDLADSLHLMEKTEKKPMVTSRLRTCTQEQSGSNQFVTPESQASTSQVTPIALQQ